MRRALGLALAAALAVALLAAGAALALTDAQVARGATVFEQSCSTCHGPNGNDGFATPLKGPGSLVRFASTRELYDYTSTTMPLAAEGSLTQRQYLDVIGWLLVQRGQPSGAAELTLATLDVTPLQPGSMTTPTASPAPTASPTPVAVPVVTATPRPVAPSATGRSIRVQRSAFTAPDPRLAHNIPDLQVTFDGQQISCNFLTHYETAGGLTRWGYATSEVLEERPNTLTQYYQRGVVDCHHRAGAWRMERRLAWDYVGGGVEGAPDLGVEPDLLSTQPGEEVGPWGHRVSNFDIDGAEIGFLDFFEALGGVTAFGFPKTDARRDDDPRAVLNIPGASPGFIRQYFQSSVMEYHPGDPEPVKLRLLGDDLRNRLYPNESFAAHASFNAADPLAQGQTYVPERIERDPQS